MTSTRLSVCPNCAFEFPDAKPRESKKCPNCMYLVAPRKAGTYRIRKALSGNPSRQCVCCGQPGSKAAEVQGDAQHLLCALCYDFSHQYVQSREMFTKYRESGGAATWIMAGKRAIFDQAPVGTVDDIRERDIPRLKDLKRRPGSYQGGVPFGYKLDRFNNLVSDDDAKVTINMIGLYLKRRMSLNAVCRELTRSSRTNKHGKVSWNPSTIRFIAEREGWI